LAAGSLIGQREDGADRFRGILDDVRVYRRALKPVELDLIWLWDLPILGQVGSGCPWVRWPEVPGARRRTAGAPNRMP
jgi:hypothetical protein